MELSDEQEPQLLHTPSVAIPVREGIEFLPLVVPTTRVMEFTNLGEGWPPRPRNQTDVQSFEATELAGTLSVDVELRIRAAALQDARVSSLLGDRYAHISTDPVSSKLGHQDCAEPVATRVTIFSYSANAAVVVDMRGTRVESVDIQHGYQPAESSEEINDAICLARADSRLAEHVELLSAAAILLPSSGEETGFGARVLWVTFYQEPASENEEAPALYGAAVDLTNRVVVMARPERPIGADDDESDDA